MSDSRVSKGDRVRRRATGEFGVVDDVEGDFAQIIFAQTGPATLHVDDVEPAAADPTLALRKGDLSPHPEYALRLQARYLQHAYKLVGRAGARSLVNGATTVGHGFEPLSQQYLISSGSSIRSVMVWLQHDPWLLVVDGRQITGLVTPSDLNRQAARSYFYLLVADFEIRLADAIRDTFDEQTDAYRFLDPAEVKGIEKRVRAARTGDIDSDVVAAMYLRNLLKIAAGSPDVRCRVDHVGTDDWEWVNSELNLFRRRVMHPVKPLLDDTSGLDELIEVEGRLRRLAGANPTGSTEGQE